MGRWREAAREFVGKFNLILIHSRMIRTLISPLNIIILILLSPYIQADGLLINI